MKVHWFTCMAALGVVIAACDRGARPPADSVTQTGASSEDAQWVNELGPVFAIHGDSERTAIVLVPAAPSSAPFDASLMRTAGDSSSTGRIALVDPEMHACGEAPVARVSVAGPSGWTVALAPTVVALMLDSIESLTPADSASLAADVARLASAVATDRESRFAGLPFAVLAAHRVRIGGSTVVVGRAARRIPQEATPLEERTLVIGEQAGSEPFALRYSLRSAGAEEVVEHYLLLAAVRSGDKHFILLESEREGGTRYEILERGAGSWQLRWSRALSC
jgi:hypothetical protein